MKICGSVNVIISKIMMFLHCVNVTYSMLCTVKLPAFSQCIWSMLCYCMLRFAYVEVIPAELNILRIMVIFTMQYDHFSTCSQELTICGPSGTKIETQPHLALPERHPTLHCSIHHISCLILEFFRLFIHW